MTYQRSTGEEQEAMVPGSGQRGEKEKKVKKYDEMMEVVKVGEW